MLWFDGFDNYSATADLATFYAAPPNGGLVAGAGRFGGNALAWNTASGTSPFSKVLDVEQTDVWAGQSVYSNSGGDPRCAVMAFRSALGQEITIALNHELRRVEVWRGSGAMLLASSVNNVFVNDGWFWLDVRCKPDDAAGVVEVWIGPTQIIDFAGDTLQNAGATGIDVIRYGNDDTFDRWSGRIDDIYADTQRAGDCRIVSRTVISDAGPNNGTPSTGVDHFALVDEAGSDPADYITLVNTTGQKERFGLSAMPVTPASIKAVAAFAFAQKSDAGAAAAHLEVISGAAVGAAASWPLLTSWSGRKSIYTQDPNTMAAWLPAAMDFDVGFAVE